MAKQKQEMQFRYYEMPEDSFVLALTGQSWVRAYGDGIDCLHFHNYAEIGVCHEGEGEMVYEDTIRHFEPGCLTFLPPNYPHTTNSKPGTLGFWEYLFVDCEGLIEYMFPRRKASARRMLDRLYRQAFFFCPGEAEGLWDKVCRVLEEQKEKGEYYRQETDALLCLILTDIVRLEKESAAVRVPIPEEGMEDGDLERLRPALQRIQEHYQEELYIGQLARLCALSETHFRRLFTDCMHLGPLDYINSVRIHSACVQLRSSNKSIRSVAFGCGFSSISTFQRNFRKFVGMSTKEWRDKPENYEYKLNQYKINRYEGW
ncbi:helix-turn-helix transcriptional regulator [Oribacterium sp. oral taxon 102]|uniref:AraC family transcriptional regulator n=1 Tax=Oribacterium sp. oral taxon 102 TaxID=671214 RepID=UPI0015BC0E26|nr:AraC family transcriptional regulator [Oribacterium sp. oral taxon 102]NWO21556.1 helix-turn-helix transcriptional regulator [Oribacterium sp. oral taxon 102]